MVIYTAGPSDALRYFDEKEIADKYADQCLKGSKAETIAVISRQPNYRRMYTELVIMIAQAVRLDEKIKEVAKNVDFK